MMCAANCKHLYHVKKLGEMTDEAKASRIRRSVVSAQILVRHRLMLMRPSVLGVQANHAARPDEAKAISNAKNQANGAATRALRIPAEQQIISENHSKAKKAYWDRVKVDPEKAPPKPADIIAERKG